MVVNSSYDRVIWMDEIRFYFFTFVMFMEVAFGYRFLV